MNPPYLILIGGGTGIGTSTIASELSKIYPVRGVQRTDSIRQVIRTFIGPLPNDVMLRSSYEAWKGIDSVYDDLHMLPFERVLYGYVRQAEHVLLGVDAAMSRDIEENINSIYEGVHVIPGKLGNQDWYDKELRIAMENGLKNLGIRLLKRGDYDNHIIEFLVDIEDEKLHRERLNKREFYAPLRSHDKYMRNFDKIRKIRDFLVRRAVENQIPIIQNTDLKESIGVCVQYITDRTNGQFMPS